MLLISACAGIFVAVDMDMLGNNRGMRLTASFLSRAFPCTSLKKPSDSWRRRESRAKPPEFATEKIWGTSRVDWANGGLGAEATTNWIEDNGVG